MKQSLFLNDFKTELIFSLLRWLFLIVVLLLFYHPVFSELLRFEDKTFHFLLAISIIYMTLAQIALYKLFKNPMMSKIILHGGIVFDYIALIWLVFLTDGSNSPLFPIAYLIIMHATIYWAIRGTMISTLSLAAGFTLVVFLKGQFSDMLSSLYFFLNLGFLIIVGLLGGLLTLRERAHLREKKEFHDLVVKDYLTGLFNHRTFQQELKSHIIKRKPFYLCMADIDHFKLINDTYGHVTGDYVLKEIGEILERTIPPKYGYAFRYGGEEFAIIIKHCSENTIKQLVSDIYVELNKKKFHEGTDKFEITMSFGVSKHLNEESGTFVKKTDELLYMAKKTGRNRAVFDDGRVLVNEDDSYEYIM
jgi:diguanylate cyclase